VKRAEIEDGVREGLTLAEQAEIRELKKRNRLLEQENEVLRRAAVSARGSTQNDLPAGPRACRGRDPRGGDLPVPGFSRQAYYKWRSNARDIHADDPVFGYRFIADELAAEHGIRASENRVHRLCSAHGIFSVLARRKGRRPRPGSRCTTTWSAAPSERALPTSCGSQASPSTPRPRQALPLFGERRLLRSHRRLLDGSPDEGAARRGGTSKNAIELRRPVGTVVYSDRGSQFRSGKFVRLLRINGLVARWDGPELVPTTPR
jgi:HTH-like domain